MVRYASIDSSVNIKLVVVGSSQKSAIELQIYIDGFPLRELDIRWLREKIGFVEQVRMHTIN